MKQFFRNFCQRGATWGAWGGPVILAIVWFCLEKAGVISTLTVSEAVLGILTTAVLGFFAAGISAVYQIEALPKGIAGLIQISVLYLDYLGFYLLNGWIPVDKIWIFTLIFVGVFSIIWLSVYIPTKIKVARMNEILEKKV